MSIKSTLKQHGFVYQDVDNIRISVSGNGHFGGATHNSVPDPGYWQFKLRVNGKTVDGFMSAGKAASAFQKKVSQYRDEESA